MPPAAGAALAETLKVQSPAATTSDVLVQDETKGTRRIRANEKVRRRMMQPPQYQSYTSKYKVNLNTEAIHDAR